MSNRFLFSLSVVLILLSYIFNIDKLISQKLSILNTNIKTTYINNFLSIEEFLSKYFNQARQIEQLKKQSLENEKYKILYQIDNNDKNSSINKLLDSVNVISYANFNDFSKVILNSKVHMNNISALITNDGYSAGIAIKQDKQIVGYLNHNTKCNYSVYIGEKLVPGITHGNTNNELITIKYIPNWKKINIGDEVITSGMDNIFSKGIAVGKVVDIKVLSSTQEAFVKPYANVYSKNYFYVYSKDLNTSK